MFGGDFVAEMEANGKIYSFNLSEKELEKAISEYKGLTAAESILLPSWGHFCAFVGVSGKTLKKVIEQGLRRDGYEKSAYYGRAVMLESFRDWCIGELLSNPNWGGKNANKAMKILAIEHGLQEAPPPKSTGPGVCVVKFGADDPRGKKAGK